MQSVRLLDERARPDFRQLYGLQALRSEALDAAVHRVRLAGMDLSSRELKGLLRIRLLIGELNALTLASEAEALAVDPLRRNRLRLLTSLFSERRLEIRIAPLAGWSPDFSVFSRLGGKGGSPTLLLGPHWFERPYPHRGPAFGIVFTGTPATLARERFDELWERGHDVRGPIESVTRAALQHSAAEASSTADYSDHPERLARPLGQPTMARYEGRP